MRLYIIRHGETEWNKEKRLQGQCEVPLNEYGRELARITGQALSDTRFDIIYSSPLSRAYETAQIIAGEREIEIIKDDRLKEISFGVAEGVPKDEQGENFKDFFFAPEKYVPSEGGETYEELVKRARDFIENIIYPQRNTDNSVLIVAHGAMNKALMLVLKNLQIKDIWKGEFQHNCCVNEYLLSEEGFEIIEEAKIYYEGETTNYLEK